MNLRIGAGEQYLDPELMPCRGVLLRVIFLEHGVLSPGNRVRTVDRPREDRIETRASSAVSEDSKSVRSDQLSYWGRRGFDEGGTILSDPSRGKARTFTRLSLQFRGEG